MNAFQLLLLLATFSSSFPGEIGRDSRRRSQQQESRRRRRQISEDEDFFAISDEVIALEDKLGSQQEDEDEEDGAAAASGEVKGKWLLSCKRNQCPYYSLPLFSFHFPLDVLSPLKRSCRDNDVHIFI
jgi:hypothetical protein